MSGSGYPLIKDSGDFLINNYKQALQVIAGQDVLEKQMRERNIVDISIFQQWLKEEQEYLTNLSREPLEETLQMEYYQKLVNLNASQ